MKRLYLALILLVLVTWPAHAQSPVTVIGPITANDCVKFNSTTIITDAGFICTGQGILPNATVAGTVLYYTGTAWVIFAGNTSGTNCLGENAVGAPQWTTCSGGSGANPGGVNGQLQINASGTFGGITVGPSLNIASTTLDTASVSNNTMMGNISGGSAAPTASTPTAFWDSFCGNTVGFIWARLTGGWACGASFAAPVTWWGAACNGSTNDTTAINTAIASGIKKIIVVGTCNVTTLTQFPVNFTLEGQNQLDSAIQTTATTGDVITLNNGDTIRDLSILSSAGRTAGSFILASQVVNLTLDNLILRNFFDGIHIHGVGSPGGVCPQSVDPCSGIHASKIRLYGPFSGSTDDCILIDGNSGGAQPWNTDIVFTDTFCTGSNTSAYLKAAVEVAAAGDVHFEHLQAIYASGNGSQGAILLDPNGTVASGHSIGVFSCSNCLLDSGGAKGLFVHATNGAGVFTVKYLGGFLTSNASDAGAYLQTDTGNSSAIGEVKISHVTIGGNANGVVLADNSAMSDVSITDNCIAGSSIDGLYLGVAQDRFLIEHNYISACSEFGINVVGVAMNIGGSASNSTAIGNVVVGNNTNVTGSSLFGSRIGNVNWP